MPSNSSLAKITAARAYGAQITFCEPNARARQAKLEEVQKETGAVFVPPYDAERTIVGQGTVWLEVEKQVEELGIKMEEVGAVVVPVGGGGLLAGVCIAAEQSGVPVYGAGTWLSRFPPPRSAELTFRFPPSRTRRSR